jgi:hypothetical protein
VKPAGPLCKHCLPERRNLRAIRLRYHDAVAHVRFAFSCCGCNRSCTAPGATTTTCVNCNSGFSGPRCERAIGQRGSSGQSYLFAIGSRCAGCSVTCVNGGVVNSGCTKVFVWRHRGPASATHVILHCSAPALAIGAGFHAPHATSRARSAPPTLRLAPARVRSRELVVPDGLSRLSLTNDWWLLIAQVLSVQDHTRQFDSARLVWILQR